MDGLPHSLPTSPSSHRSQTSYGNMSSSHHQVHSNRTNSISAAHGMDGILAERMAAGGGALCNDQNGLCLGSRGDIDARDYGVYTGIAKLANQLDNTIDGRAARENQVDVPLISIQTERAALLVKEYGGRTVVFKVPTEIEKNHGLEVSEVIADGDVADSNG